MRNIMKFANLDTCLLPYCRDVRWHRNPKPSARDLECVEEAGLTKQASTPQSAAVHQESSQTKRS